MAIPGAGWSIIWGPAGDYAYLLDPDGNIVSRWFADNPEMSTFDPETTQGIIDQATGGDGDAGFDLQTAWEDWLDSWGDSGSGWWDEAPQSLEDLLRLQQEYTEYMVDYQEQQDTEAEARYQERLEESRAYSEAQALASQHMRQEQNWGYAAANAPGAGAGILANLLPGYLPGGVAQSLYGYGKRMGTGYDPAWPGGTGLNEAQMTPTGMDWIEYLKQQGYPGYLWER